MVIQVKGNCTEEYAKFVVAKCAVKANNDLDNIHSVIFVVDRVINFIEKEN